MANQKEKLFQDFPAVTTAEWMEKITADLKGADFEKKLVWKTNEGFKVNPFYREENIDNLKTKDSLPGEYPYVRGTSQVNDWHTRQDIVVTDIKAANEKALSVLDKGITSLNFIIKSADVSPENVKTLLKNIVPEAVELNFSTCNKKAIELVTILAEYYKASGANLLNCYGSINFDPFKPLLKKGKACDNWADQAAEIVKAAIALPRFRVLAVNAHSLSDGGAYIYQELGCALANGNTLLSKLVEAGLDTALVAKKIKFNFGISGNYFMEIAKFRAARWLWALIVGAYEPLCKNDCPSKSEEGLCRCASKMYVHAETSRYNKTIFDAHVNLLRTQTETMSAAIAGVNSITVRPFDETYKEADEFSERIARNQQLLLKEESHFNKVTDVSAGSYYIENLTSSLAEQAWNLFIQLDEQGYYEELKKGTIQDAIAAAADSRRKAAATRREMLLGTNQYPNFTEVAGDKIIPEKACGCGCEKDKGEYKTLPKGRLAEDFEELRLATEKSSKTPKVFMLTIGNLNMRLARAQFAANFFACAGYQVVDNLGFETVAQGVEAARKAGADIIVLCSSDDEYATYAPEAFDLVKGKEQFVVAGAPKCMEELQTKGIEHFIHVRSNVLETLQGFNKIWGIN